MSLRIKLIGLVVIVFLCQLSLTGFISPMADSVILYTPYTKISVSPGQSVDYSIDLINKSTEIINSEISVRGLPVSWKYNIKAGNYDIRRLSVLSGDKKSIILAIEVPFNVNKGSYPFKVIAGNNSELSLTIVVSEQGSFKTEFTTDQGNMEGNTTSIFTYRAVLKNITAEKQMYALTAEAPPGWNVAFKYNSRQVTSVEVNENNNVSIIIEIDPPDMISAGTYRIPVRASTSSTSADLGLEVVVKGSYAMELTTPSGLLSTGITAGDQKRIELILRNTGSAQLKGVQLSASTPINWEVTFDPKKIDIIEPGATSQVFALVKAAKHAIAGDYVTTIDAKSPEASSKIQFRISVRTSMIWGWVGILIIFVALSGVYFLFRKYGRR